MVYSGEMLSEKKVIPAGIFSLLYWNDPEIFCTICLDYQC